MELKLILLNDGTYIITWIYELPIEPKAFLANPLKIVKSGKGIALKRFPEYTEQDFLLLYSTCITTIAEPDETVRLKYKKLYPDKPDIELPTFDNEDSAQLLNEDAIIPPSTEVL